LAQGRGLGPKFATQLGGAACEVVFVAMPPNVVRPPLCSTRSWVRIRPLGADGHADGQACEKQLGDFDETAVNIISHDQGGTVGRYDWMTKVFPVDCTQEDVAGDILPDILNDFWTNKNALIFAYGQTGTGKTHTMFGVQESLSETTDNPGWGLLPRAVHATLQHIETQAAQGVGSILLLSAVEFYTFQCYDLADTAGKQMCTMKGSQVVGNSYQVCDSPAVLAEFLDRVYNNRNVVATKMNAGSSRSHCAITLTLLTHDTNTDEFRQTAFSIVDLAGAERPEKASHIGKRITKTDAMMELFAFYKKGCQGTLSLELQGYLINGELTGLLDTVVAASNLAKQGKEYKEQNYLGGATTSFFGGALAGEARLDALICLSQSPQNGWETWFSTANYGAKLSQLRTRVKSVRSAPMAKVLVQAEKDLTKAEEALATTPDSASGRKYLAFRIGMKVYTEQRLQFIRQLAGLGGGRSGASAAFAAP